MLLSIVYFIVIPIIPDRKHPNIVTDIMIPVFVVSLVFIITPIITPNDKPAKEPHSANKTISDKLFP